MRSDSRQRRRFTTTTAIHDNDNDSRQRQRQRALVEDALKIGSYAKASAELGRALRLLLTRRSNGNAAFRRSPIGAIVFDVWRTTADFSSQYLCDYAGASLLHDPNDEGALDLFLQGSFEDGPYLHRGVDLESIASSLPDGRRKAELWAFHALIHETEHPASDEAFLARARAMLPSIDIDALRKRCDRARGPLYAALQHIEQGVDECSSE